MKSVSEKEQTAEHIITSCPIYHHPNASRTLSDVKKPGDRVAIFNFLSTES